MKRFGCRVEYLAHCAEIQARLSKGDTIKEIYNTLKKSNKISMSYKSFYNYCTGKIKAISNTLAMPVEKNNKAVEKPLLAKPLPVTKAVTLMENKNDFF